MEQAPRTPQRKQMPDETADNGMSLDDAISTSYDDGGEHAESEDTSTYDSVSDGPRLSDYETQDTQEESPEDIEERNAGLRQADYTRKTQQLAEERAAFEAERQQLLHAQAIWDSLRDDPRGTIEALTEHFGDVLMESPPSEEALRLQNVEQYIEEQQNQILLNELYSQCNEIAQEFNDPFNADQLIEFAVEAELPNLRAAYLLRRDQLARQARDQERTAKKASAPPVLGGSSRPPGRIATPPDEIKSFEDAFNAALSEL